MIKHLVTQLAHCHRSVALSGALSQVFTMVALLAFLSGSLVSVSLAQTPVHVGNCGPVPVNSCMGPPTCKKSPVYGGTWIPGPPRPQGTACTTNNVPSGPTGSCNGAGLCVGAPAGPSGVMTPKYIILTLIYAPPGNGSAVVYSSANSSGTTTGHSQLQGGAFTAGITGNVIFTDTVTGTTTKASTLQVTDTITQGVQATSTADALDHGKDTFYILVHPPFNYQQATAGGPIEISPASALAQLTPLILDVNELTGKEPIPADKQGQLLDLTPQDLATIATADPLVSAPGNFSSSRFQKVDQVQLEGPDYAGALIDDSPYTESAASTACQTVANAFQNTVTVGFTAGADFFGQGEKAIFTASMIEGHTSTTGDCAGTTTTAAFTPRSSTVQFGVPVDVYQDGVFHTFAFSEAKPVSAISPIVTGVLHGTNGKPLGNHIVTVKFPNGSLRHIATDPQGKYSIVSPPAGTITIQSGLSTAKTKLAIGQANIPVLTLSVLGTKVPGPTVK